MYGEVEDAVKIAVNELLKYNFNLKIHKFTDSFQASISDILGDVINAENYAIKKVWKTHQNAPLKSNG